MLYRFQYYGPLHLQKVVVLYGPCGAIFPIAFIVVTNEKNVFLDDTTVSVIAKTRGIDAQRETEKRA